MTEKPLICILLYPYPINHNRSFKQLNLSKLNTFGLQVRAQHLKKISTTEEAKAVVEKLGQYPNFLILGGGSNILFSKDFEGLIIQNEILGVQVIEENRENVRIKVGAGENWHKFVLFAVEKNYCGIENLSLIPGKVGATPIQNIGAYGVEVGEFIESVEFLDIEENTIKQYSKEACQFGYRNSIFKNILKGKVIITHVIFNLRRIGNINTTYAALSEELRSTGILNPTIRDVSNAVIRIRRRKLPDPSIIGNAGSFFKNPEISQSLFDSLFRSHPKIVFYQMEKGVKLAAGWLIEQCGWKGFREGDAGVHEKQALVLVNYGSAQGKDILRIAERIEESVFAKFGVELEREVNVV